MLKTKTDKLRALDFTDKFNMCSYINSMKGDIDIINITHADGRYTIFYLQKRSELYRSRCWRAECC